MKRGACTRLGSWKKLPDSAKCKSSIPSGKLKMEGEDAIYSVGFQYFFFSLWVLVFVVRTSTEVTVTGVMDCVTSMLCLGKC